MGFAGRPTRRGQGSNGGNAGGVQAIACETKLRTEISVEAKLRAEKCLR